MQRCDGIEVAVSICHGHANAVADMPSGRSANQR